MHIKSGQSERQIHYNKDYDPSGRYNVIYSSQSERQIHYNKDYDVSSTFVNETPGVCQRDRSITTRITTKYAKLFLSLSVLSERQIHYNKDYDYVLLQTCECLCNKVREIDPLQQGLRLCFVQPYHKQYKTSERQIHYNKDYDLS